jgi:peptidylprolyl isomerase
MHLNFTNALVIFFAIFIFIASCNIGKEEKPVQPEVIVAADSIFANGLWVRDIELGEGPAIDNGDYFKAHYTGYLSNGDIFDTSFERADPINFQLGVGQVVPAWDEGIRGMRAGGKRILVAPPELGFGAAGIPGIIPANDTLTFEVELLEVRKTPSAWSLENVRSNDSESGITSYIHEVGRGKRPESEDLVAIHYSGYLETGYLFDSSFLRDDYFRFRIGTGQVITGLEEVISEMRVGERRTVFIPAGLAYGNVGSAGIIPGNSTLRFDVELIEIAASER